MANANTVASSEKEAYRARETVFQSYLVDKARPAEMGVKMLGVVESAAPILRKYDPQNPLANEQGYVFSSNVNSVEEMVMLNVKPNPFLERMTSLLYDAAVEIYRGALRLEDHPNVANDHAVRAKALENRMETVYREAINELFKAPDDLEGMVEILKLREIYRHLSNAADRGDAAANVIGDIVVKKI